MDWIWAFDQSVQQAVNGGMRSEPADLFFRVSTWIGLDHFVVPALLILVLIPTTRRLGWQSLLAYGIAGLAALLIKIQIPRFRPG